MADGIHVVTSHVAREAARTGRIIEAFAWAETLGGSFSREAMAQLRREIPEYLDSLAPQEPHHAD